MLQNLPNKAFQSLPTSDARKQEADLGAAPVFAPVDVDSMTVRPSRGSSTRDPGRDDVAAFTKTPFRTGGTWAHSLLQIFAWNLKFE